MVLLAVVSGNLGGFGSFLVLELTLINHYPMDKRSLFCQHLFTGSRFIPLITIIHLSNNWGLTYESITVLLNLDMVTTCYFQLHIRCGCFALSMSWQDYET